jgi:hypothetical protein
LLNVSKMKSCSVPQIGDKWEWKQFNKAPTRRSEQVGGTRTFDEPPPLEDTTAPSAQG